MSEPNLIDAFRAFRVHVDAAGAVTRGVEEVSFETLPKHDVTVRVAYSSLNYKDALSASGNRGVTRSFPHTPGIDAAGTVVQSQNEEFSAGDEVIVTGFDLGMNTPGGFGEYVRVPAEWLVRLPAGLTPRQAVALGTAGFTASLALERLAFAGAVSSLGPLIVTGASGGVGSLAVALAADAGYEVIASSGKESAEPLLKRLGATRVVGRAPLNERQKGPLGSGEYGAAIDTVGGVTLENLIRSTNIGGAVAACGLVGGAELSLTVYPFILRGVALLGVDSQHAPFEVREDAWRELASNERLKGLLEESEYVREVTLEELEGEIGNILAGGVTGRVVVKVGA